jgi:hypothetical protein
MDTTDKQTKADDGVLKAAMALNYSAVSISNIIESNDKVILDQEYNAILNNINMQEIVKDDELRQLFTRILDTCNFFKIQEGDRAWVLREYDNNMKNAIFSCMPQFNLILAGGNPWTMLIGAVHQVGVCYMNYRRNVNQYREGKDKSLWELEKGTIEELHGLRKELFNASWNLSKKYNIPDEWRITQPQIDRYLQVLKDDDSQRKLDRLEYMQDEFMAYPPFWYQKGSIALAQGRSLNEAGDNSGGQRLTKIAETAYDKFDLVWRPIIRNDQYAAMTSLDRVAMLDPARDRDRIAALLDRLCRNAKYDYDIVQFAAIHYLSIQDVPSVERLLSALINESRNLPVNGKLLSRIYIEQNHLPAYENLKKRIGAENVISPEETLFEASAIDVITSGASAIGIWLAYEVIEKVSDHLDKFIADESPLEEQVKYVKTTQYIKWLDDNLERTCSDMFTELIVDEFDLISESTAQRVSECRQGMRDAAKPILEKFIKLVAAAEVAGCQMIGKEPSFVGKVAKGAGVGVLAGVFLGPIGIGAAIIGNFLHDILGSDAEEAEKKFAKNADKAIRGYKKMYLDLGTAFAKELRPLFVEMIRVYQQINDQAKAKAFLDFLTTTTKDMEEAKSQSNPESEHLDADDEDEKEEPTE